MTFEKTLALLAPRYDYCGGAGGSWIPAHWDSGHPDSWSPCAGCVGCVPAIALASFFAVFPAAPALAGFAALAAIGKAVTKALAPGKAIAAFVSGAVSSWNGPAVKGAWYEVTAKRGSAKNHYGVTGECVWIGANTNFRYGRAVGMSTRVGLKTLDSDAAVFVPASCTTRVAPPVAALPAIAAKEAAKAEKAARVPYAASRGEVVSVVHGFSAGRVGKVFWVGSGKAGARYGLDPDVNRKRGRCESPLWVDAVDCGPFAPSPAKTPVVPITAIPAAIPAATPVVNFATAKATVALASGPAPACSGKHTKFDGSYWVNDAKGIPVARVCDKCKTAKLKKYRPEIFENANYETTETV